MKLEGKRVGFAMCGSFCTFSHCFTALETLKNNGCELIPIMSFNAYSINTRFGDAKDHIRRLEEMCGRKIIHTIEDAEPLGPKNMTDVMLVANCTGNTLAKLAMSITDTAVVVKRKLLCKKHEPTPDEVGSYNFILKTCFFVPPYFCTFSRLHP